MSFPFLRLIHSWLLLSLGVLVSAHVVPGIDYSNIPTLVVVVIVLSLFNAILKPILLLFTLPFIVLTMGIGILFINAFLFLLVGKLVDGFQVAGFGAAFLGGLIISIITVLINSLLLSAPSDQGKKKGPHKKGRSKNDDIIDI